MSEHLLPEPSRVELERVIDALAEVDHPYRPGSGRTERYNQYCGHSGLDGDHCWLAVRSCDNHRKKCR